LLVILFSGLHIFSFLEFQHEVFSLKTFFFDAFSENSLIYMLLLGIVFCLIWFIDIKLNEYVIEKKKN